eukprot:156806_1
MSSSQQPVGSLRRRTTASTTSIEPETKQHETEVPNKDAPNQTPKGITTTYWMTSILILRSIALVYFTGFSVAYFQNKPLIGTHGIYPYTAILDRYSTHYTSYWDQYVNLPTLLWFMPRTNDSIDQIALCGMLLSSLVLIFGYTLCHSVVFLSLWLLYHSLVNVGGLFYGYGWESQVLETGFLAIFLCRIRLTPWRYNPQLRLDQKPAVPPSYLIIFLYLWLCFKIMIGAGMIKIRAGKCWLDYTCMDYHYETQPNPNPMAWIMHNNPRWFHQFEVATNHFVELIAPWFLLIPFRKVAIISALIQIAFQFLIIMGGNLSFLNWMTMIPALAGLDDAFCYDYLWFLYPKREREYLYHECAKYYVEYRDNQSRIEAQHATIVNESLWFKKWRCCRVFSLYDLLYKVLCLCVAILIVYLSVDVVHNLLSSRQIMNTSFDKFRLVNTYGAFGTVEKERFEVVFWMTGDEYVDDDTPWTEIVFKCKPGPLDRRPCVITPYHYRVDWQIWFAGFEPHTPNRHPWIFLFVAQLLNHDGETIELLDGSVEQFMQNNNVTYIKADMFKYKFTKQWSDMNWWTREMTSTYLPPLDLNNKHFKNVLSQLSWSGNKTLKKKKKRNRKKKRKKIEL